MPDSCLIITDNIVTKNDLSRRLSMYFKEFISLEYDRVLNYINITKPDVLFIEWSGENTKIIKVILGKFQATPNIIIYIIKPDEISITEIASTTNFRSITASNLQETDLAALLGLTGRPIYAGDIILWPASGNVLCGDGLEGVSPNEYPFVKLSSKDRVRILEFLMIYAKGIENAKTSNQILDGAWFSNDGPVSVKAIQTLISGIRHQIERNPADPKILRSGAGRPGSKSKTLPGYYIDVSQELSKEVIENVDLFSANPIFSNNKVGAKKSTLKIFRRLSEWILTQ